MDDVPAADAGRYGGGYFIEPHERESVMNDCSRNSNLGLFIKHRQYASDSSLEEINLVASNRSRPASQRNMYLEGYWDVARAGSEGTFGSRGKYMMGLFTRWY